MDKSFRIAGLRVALNSFGRTLDHALPYMIEDCLSFDIYIHANQNAISELYPNLSLDGCEYIATGKEFYTQLLRFDGMMLHSSALLIDGRAYLFTADPGTGKSTHVCLWRRVFGDERVRVLNDDKPALRLEEGVWYAYGTPWSGKTGQNLNLRAPVAGIAVIERGEQNEIAPFGGKEAVSAILRQTTNVKDPMLQIKKLELIDKLFKDVPIWKLKCNMEPEAAIVSYEAMSGKKWEGR